MTQPSVNDLAYLTAYAGQFGEVKFLISCNVCRWNLREGEYING